MNRSTARENVFILLFEGVCQPDEDPNELISKVEESREFESDAFVRNVFFGVYEHLDEIDALINKNLVGWSKARVSSVSKALLRLSVYEMLYVEDVPTKASMNEAIELSKKFDDDKAYLFVNGVLNAVATEKGLK